MCHVCVCTLSAALFSGDQTTADVAYFYQDMSHIPNSSTTCSKGDTMSMMKIEQNLFELHNDSNVQWFNVWILFELTFLLNFMSRGCVRIRRGIHLIRLYIKRCQLSYLYINVFFNHSGTWLMLAPEAVKIRGTKR